MEFFALGADAKTAESLAPMEALQSLGPRRLGGGRPADWGTGSGMGDDNLVLWNGQDDPDGLGGQVIRDRNRLATYRGE